MKSFKIASAVFALGCLAAPMAVAEVDTFSDYCVSKATELGNPDAESFCSCLVEKAAEDPSIETDLRAVSDETTIEDVVAGLGESAAAAVQACEG